jgi:hypothetical protein
MRLEMRAAPLTPGKRKDRRVWSIQEGLYMRKREGIRFGAMARDAFVTSAAQAREAVLNADSGRGEDSNFYETMSEIVREAMNGIRSSPAMAAPCSVALACRVVKVHREVHGDQREARLPVRGILKTHHVLMAPRAGLQLQISVAGMKVP